MRRDGVEATAPLNPSRSAGDALAIEMLISRFYHPIWTKFASTIFVATGVGLLWGGFPIIAAALIFYGARAVGFGVGLRTMAGAVVGHDAG